MSWVRQFREHGAILRSGALLFLIGAVACSRTPEVRLEPATTVLGCDSYQSIEVDAGVLYNNVWNKEAAADFEWEQCLVQKPESAKAVFGWSWKWPKQGQQIFAYPQIKMGTSPWDPLPHFDRRFPLALDDLKALTVSHELELSADGDFNVATSMWLTTTPEIGRSANTSVIAAELMIWTYATKKHMRPAGRKVGILHHNDVNWTIWLDEDWGDASMNNENRWRYIAFEADTPSLNSRFDIIELLRAPELSKLELDQLYLADIELGTEIMRGSGLAWVKAFNVSIEEK